MSANQSVYICVLLKFQDVAITSYHFLSLLEGSLNISTNAGSGQPILTCWDTRTQIDLDQKVGQQLGSIQYASESHLLTLYAVPEVHSILFPD